MKNDEASRPDPVKTSDDNKTSAIKASSKNYRELYQKATQDNTRKDCEQKSEEYEDIDLYDDDDNDSFITIDEDYEDYEDEDGASDSTLENSQSSDSGYTDGSSYGVNPLFSHQANDGTEACQDDFVFFNQKKGEFQVQTRRSCFVTLFILQATLRTKDPRYRYSKNLRNHPLMCLDL